MIIEALDGWLAGGGIRYITPLGPLSFDLATDPGSVKDFASFSKQTANELVGQQEANGVFEFYLKRK